MSTSEHADLNLIDVRLTRIQIKKLTRTLQDLVVTARNNGATWEEIGEALATTKQAAQQRYGAL